MPTEDVVAVGNMTPALARVSVSKKLTRRLLCGNFNTDAKEYGGLGFGNNCVRVEAIEWNGRPFSIVVQMPPQSMSVFLISRITQYD